MKCARWYLALVWGFLMVALPSGLIGQTMPPEPVTIARLSWLAGSWRLEKAGRVVEEQWMAPAGGVMLGMSRTVTKGKLTEYEFMQVREGPGGELYFVAQPYRQKETAFRLQSQSAG
jgi:hypothetical protein